MTVPEAESLVADMKRLTDEFVAEARNDLVGLWEIAREFESSTADAEAVRDQTMDLVRTLLAGGLIAGDSPYSAQGFRPWRNQVPDAVIDRIRSEWIALGRPPNIPDIVWFSGRD